ncbi:uncharacterized protein E0L32_002727 [Thyridium curvatum]|uniref:Letm1 RBD domain-containing protein n=1 Tax=Thyridium curvatum TaxID=1093900 RepID=A0A507BN57_9PEZI|nr:uncharacterized protein E0L32_002727 [Thyridium curvatum]TPX18218.1 hypothetical protein E0L32_002727 [Thyridium curvatum]
MTAAFPPRALRASLSSLQCNGLSRRAPALLPAREQCPILSNRHYLLQHAQVRLASSSSSTSPLLEPTAPVLSPAAVNPPATTRPPPLVLPERLPDTATFNHLLATGKAYLKFYKTGLKYLYVNTKLVYALRSGGAGSASSSSPTDSSPGAKPGSDTATTTPVLLAGGTRSALLLRERWAHDMRRLPVFAVMFLLCGEFTPLVVLALPHAVPYTCRIPKQVAKLQRLAEERRRASYEALGIAEANSSSSDETAAAAAAAAAAPPTPAQQVHVSKSLNLVSPLWDRIGFAPSGLARARADKRVARLLVDDALLRQGGGAPALEADEVRLACADRGVDVLGCDEAELRAILAAWLRLAEAHDGGGEAEQARRVYTLLTTRPEEWPALEKR